MDTYLNETFSTNMVVLNVFFEAGQAYFYPWLHMYHYLYTSELYRTPLGISPRAFCFVLCSGVDTLYQITPAAFRALMFKDDAYGFSILPSFTILMTSSLKGEERSTPTIFQLLSTLG